MIMKSIAAVLFCMLVSSCGHRETVPGIYRLYAGKSGGFDIWIVDGYKVRQKIYREFLYGGNEQRYPYVPKGEIWIDHAVSCEEYGLTLAHELNERHLMAKFGWSYDRSHDSSLAIELVMRHRFDSTCHRHEEKLGTVAPADWSNHKEIRSLPDTIRLRDIYRIPLGTREDVTVWIVDGYRVRKNIFPDFGFSGNDLACRFIPPNEIWIDGQVTAEEMEYSIAAELMERKLMKQGRSFSDAYEASVGMVSELRERMEGRIKNHPPLVVPDTLARESGLPDPAEK
jgi:hypothetical protein